MTLEQLNTALNETSRRDWVNKTEVSGNVIKLTTNDGYLFFVTLSGVEYKGKGDVEVPETIPASEVGFTPSSANSGWTQKNGSPITTVEQALDSLYGD